LWHGPGRRWSSSAADLVDDGLGDVAVVVGYLDADGAARVSAAATAGKGPRNALAVLRRGEVVARYFKHHLPNYGVFDEDRYFVPGDTFQVVRLGGVDIGLTICEDLWQAGGPFAVAAAARVGLVLNINGSPYEVNKDDVRLPLVQRRAAEAAATVAYVNMVGGQDELIFDGDSMVVTPDGTVLARGSQFAEELLLIDLDLPAAADDQPPAEAGGMRIQRTEVPGPLAELGEDRIEGRIADRSPTRPRSGRRSCWACATTSARTDSGRSSWRCRAASTPASSAAIAVDAVGSDQVYGVSLPSGHSSQHSRHDAADLAQRTGLHFHTTPIQPMVDGLPGQRRAGRRGGGEPAGPGARRDPDGTVQSGRPPRAAPPATRASWRSATRPCTATPSAASTRSRTCSRRWCGSWPAGATPRPSARGDPARSR
jgi:NAD+ synthase (glutamine-hydrolysing)